MTDPHSTDPPELGRWWNPATSDVTQPGKLDLSPRTVPVLTLMAADGMDGAKGERGLFGFDLPAVIHGSVPGRGPVSLLDPEHSHFGMEFRSESTQVIRCRLAVSGRDFLTSPAHKRFRRLEVIVPALGPLVSPEPFTVPDWPYVDFVEPSGRVALHLDQTSYCWNDDDVRTEWTLPFHASWDPPSAKIRMVPTVTFTAPYPKSIIWWLEEWLLPTLQLIIGATGSSPSPVSISAWHKRNPPQPEKDQTKYEVFTHWLGDDDESEVEWRNSLPMFTAESLGAGGGLRPALDGVQRLVADDDVFVSMVFSSLLTPDRPIRNRFLDLASGLEAYDYRRNGPFPEASDSYKIDRKAVLKRLADVADLQPPDLTFVKKHLIHRPAFAFHGRISRLLRTTRVDAAPLSADRIGQLRNLVAHGEATDVEEIGRAHEVLMRMSRALICLEAGIPVQ